MNEILRTSISVLLLLLGLSLFIWVGYEAYTNTMEDIKNNKSISMLAAVFFNFGRLFLLILGVIALILTFYYGPDIR